MKPSNTIALEKLADSSFIDEAIANANGSLGVYDTARNGINSELQEMQAALDDAKFLQQHPLRRLATGVSTSEDWFNSHPLLVQTALNMNNRYNDSKGESHKNITMQDAKKQFAALTLGRLAMRAGAGGLGQMIAQDENQSSKAYLPGITGGLAGGYLGTELGKKLGVKDELARTVLNLGGSALGGATLTKLLS